MFSFIWFIPPFLFFVSAKFEDLAVVPGSLVYASSGAMFSDSEAIDTLAEHFNNTKKVPLFSTFAPMNIRDTNSDARPPVSISGNTRGIVRSVAQVGIPRVPLRVPVVPQGPMKKQVSVYPKGELYQHPVHLYKKCPQVARLDFSVEASFESAIFSVVKFGVNNILRKTLRGVSKAFRDMVDKVPRLLDVDFLALTEPRLNYAAQTEIDMNRVEQLSAASVYYNLNFGLVACMLGVEVFGDHRDVKDICERARLVSSESDVKHIKRILTDGCPAKFDYEEPVENKKMFLQ